MDTEVRKKKRKHKKKKTSKLILASQADLEGSNHETENSIDEPIENILVEEETNSQSRKRLVDVDEAESDSESKPKRKKKKKKPILEDAPTGKGKKSIRQMKREKHNQRKAEEKFAAKDELKTQSLSYISQWKHDRQNWKFMKARQVWLYKNKFSTTLVPNESWPVLLEYFESTQGNIRKMLLDDANKVIKEMDDWIEKHGGDKSKSEDGSENEDAEDEKPDKVTYKRARDLIQCLEE